MNLTMNDTELHAAFPPTPSWTHLNNAGMARPCAAAVETMQTWVSRFQMEAAHAAPEFLHVLERARQSVAALIGCQSRELGFFQSTSGAVSQVAFGMNLQPGDEILTWDQEYPSNSLPWRVAAERTGARLVTVSSGHELSTPVEKLLQAITARTKVIAISWVQYQTGAITDLQRLTEVTRAKNIWTVVDVIQGLGQLPFDFASSGVDAICGGSHKWMLSFLGVGFLAVCEERLKELKPLMIGTETFQAVGDAKEAYRQEKNEAQKFEPGSKQFLEIAALGATADFLRKVSVEVIAREIHQRAEYLRNGLRKRGFHVHCPHEGSPRGSIVNFSKGGARDRALFEEQLKKHNISYSQRASGIRWSPHVYNSIEELDRALNLLEGVRL